MPIIVDLIMIGLLIGVIIYTTRLSHSLNNFKSLHAEISPLLRDHIHSISNSLKHYSELKHLSEEVNKTISLRSREYKTMQDDLQFLYDRALTACDRLEALIDQERLMMTKSKSVIAEDPKKTLNERKNIQLHADREDHQHLTRAEKFEIGLLTVV